MNLHVNHPALDRDKLDGKTLAIFSFDSSIRLGHLKVSELQADGRYLLTFQESAYPDAAVLEKPWTKLGQEPSVGGIVQPPAMRLDQASVSKIQSISESVLAGKCGCDFVLVEG